jgi:hypothetical protein
MAALHSNRADLEKHKPSILPSSSKDYIYREDTHDVGAIGSYFAPQKYASLSNHFYSLAHRELEMFLNHSRL